MPKLDKRHIRHNNLLFKQYKAFSEAPVNKTAQVGKTEPLNELFLEERFSDFSPALSFRFARVCSGKPSGYFLFFLFFAAFWGVTRGQLEGAYPDSNVLISGNNDTDVAPQEHTVHASQERLAGVKNKKFSYWTHKVDKEIAIERLDKSIIMSADLHKVLSTQQIEECKQAVTEVLHELYELSEANRDHMNYVLASNLKLELFPENPKDPGHAQYDALEHKITIPVLYNRGAIRIAIKKRDHFKEELRYRILHEMQHAKISLINSKDCQPALAAKKLIGTIPSAENIPLSMIRNQKAVIKKIEEAEQYVLDHVAKILPANGEYIDYTKKYSNTKVTQAFFKKAGIQPNSKDAEKELAFLQKITKNYQPRRYTAVLEDKSAFTNWEAEGKIKQLKNGKPFPLVMHGYTVFIDSIEERHGHYYATGYRVENPQDKVRAFVEDTDYNKKRIAKVYTHIIVNSVFPHHKLAAERDGHLFECGDISILEQIYTELMEQHEEARDQAECDPFR